MTESLRIDNTQKGSTVTGVPRADSIPDEAKAIRVQAADVHRGRGET
jgi:hypothetical protein